MLCQMRGVSALATGTWLLVCCMLTAAARGHSEAVLWCIAAVLLLAVVPVPRGRILWVLDRTARASLWGAIAGGLLIVLGWPYGATSYVPDEVVRDFVLVALLFWGMEGALIGGRIGECWVRRCRPEAVIVYGMAVVLGAFFALARPANLVHMANVLDHGLALAVVIGLFLVPPHGPFSDCLRRIAI